MFSGYTPARNTWIEKNEHEESYTYSIRRVNETSEQVNDRKGNPDELILQIVKASKFSTTQTT